MPIFGDKRRIAFDIINIDPNGEFKFILWFNNNIFWGPVYWSCINFLYELSLNWNEIFFNQKYNVIKSANEYYKLQEKNIKNNINIEKSYCEFNNQHTISYWFDGLSLKELMIFVKKKI